MRHQRLAVSICFIICVVLGFWYVMRPCLFVKSGSRLLAALPVKAGSRFSIHFVHSVQKTPIDEFLIVDDDCRGFVLKSTRYRSFGVGLPFAEEQGTFRQENGYFIYENLNRKFPSLSLRTGLGTRLTVRAGDEELRLFELLPVGEKVDIFIMP